MHSRKNVNFSASDEPGRVASNRLNSGQGTSTRAQPGPQARARLAWLEVAFSCYKQISTAPSPSPVPSALGSSLSRFFFYSQKFPRLSTLELASPRSLLLSGARFRFLSPRLPDRLPSFIWAVPSYVPPRGPHARPCAMFAFFSFFSLLLELLLSTTTAPPHQPHQPHPPRLSPWLSQTHRSRHVGA